MVAKPIAMTNTCSACKTVGPARLYRGQVCAACEAQNAWSKLGETGRLVIDRDSIDAAVKRRHSEAAGQPLWRRLLVWATLAMTLGVAVIAGWFVWQLLSARSIGPLDALLGEMMAAARWTTVIGLATLILGVVALVRSRRNRHFRRISILAGHLIVTIVGCTAFVVGVFHWIAQSPQFGGQYTSMPARESLGVPSHVERILNATVVILAPGADGDARNLAMGTGAVVATDDTRAWIVTCSHVAMPYAAVGTWRHARDAQPVWMQLSDGREGRARVRWTAPPPLDVALVELSIAHPPEPVVIAADTSRLEASANLIFVPNPYRAGWKVLHGGLLRRETHHTPAGTYDLLYTDLPVIPGDSGSGLYDARGQLVGLNTWTRAGDGPAQGISLPSETMRVLVDAIQNGNLDNLDEAVLPPPRE
jgi:S1-C subfamily serine protease